MDYRPLVETLIRAVVEKPEALEIEEETEAGARTFYVRVDPEDVGKVIGKRGQVISNIRCVVSAVASKSREKAFVKVVTE